MPVLQKVFLLYVNLLVTHYKTFPIMGKRLGQGNLFEMGTGQFLRR